jgi:hypothetical protein
MDAAARDYDSEGSDGVYDLAKERKKKADLKAKQARKNSWKSRMAKVKA